MLNLYFNPTGRIRRSTWWLHTIILWVGTFAVTFALGFATAILGTLAGLDPWEIAGWVDLVAWGVYALFMWCWITLSIKRLHDRDRSAWWMLLWVATIIGFVIWIVMVGCQAGDDGPNRYGEKLDPASPPNTGPLPREFDDVLL